MKKFYFLLVLLVMGVTGTTFGQSITVTSPNGGEIWPACASRTISWAATGTSGYYNVDYSTNGGTTWASIATFLNATSLSWTVPNVQSTNCLVRVLDSYNNTVVDQSNAVFTINASVRVTAPNGGESWQVGNPATQNITWVASGTGTYVTIEYSIDAGTTWTTITTSAVASSGSYTWTIPNTPSTQCLVRVRDNNTPCMQDVCDNLFTIVAPTPTITVTSPNTAVTWYVGYSYTIQWTSQYVTNPYVAIDYSTDGGSSWTSVISSTNNSGSYSWTVPNTPSSQCRVRVKDASNPSTNDISNVNFTIATPVWTITVTTPNGGETFNSCNTYNITWSNTFVTGNYKIEYSTDNGASWVTIVSSTSSSSSYSWQVPNTIATSSQCLIKVSSVTNPAVYDVSNATFTINQVQYVIISSPNGGESWQVGNPATRTINWVFSGTGNYFYIEYSTDNGTTWNTIVSNYYAASSPASYTWTLPNTPSNLCLVRVSDYSNTCRSDVSNNPFSILAPTPVITVTSPNTATTWYVGSTYSINWTSQYVTNPYVTIEYSTDNGTTWTTIISNTNNTGSYSWTIPNTPSTTCLVRVKDASNPSTNDVSNVNFTIATPVSTITVAAPNGGETWNSCSTYTISWSYSNVTGSFKIEYSTDGGSTWNLITTTTASSYNWQVPNTIATSSQCLVRISSVSNPSISDISNAAFTINRVQFIAVTSPNGGESWQVGNPTTRTITWAYSGTTNYFLLEYSTDNGVTWNTIVSNYYQASSPASYTWTIPNNPSANCLVRVSDYSLNCRNDVSDAVFSIIAPTPVITVTAPNTATTWYVGNSYNITWTSAYVTDPFVAIEYSIDSGSTWLSVTSAINTTLGTYSWTVPNTPSTACYVRVKSTANPSTIYDLSNIDFTIATPVWAINVVNPNGGESWNTCATYTISWGYSFVTGSFRIDYSTDNGATWNYIATTTSSSYNWQVPNTIATSSQCLIKVSSVSQPAVYDVSNAVFTINQVQYVVVTSPNGGESWQVANPTTRTITWAYSGTTNYFLLEYSTDNGTTWNTIVSNYYQASSPASYTWTIPNNPSTNCLVRVSDYSQNCRSDVSNAVFAIVAPTPVITVTAPNTATTWYVGNSYNITWTSAYVTDPFVAIEYSYDGGATYNNIVSSINTSVGTYSWTVPNTPSTQCVVRIKSTANPSTIYDVSNVNFTIATPVWTINVASPNGGETWNSCNTYTINWGYSFVTGSFRIDYSTDGGTTWNYIATTTSSSYGWQVPNYITTSNQCLIKVSSVSQPSVYDISNAYFTINQVQYIVVTSPNGGESWQVGNPTTRTITWAFSGTTNYFLLEYSTDNGTTWNTIVTNYYQASSPASYTWTIPNNPSANCLVRVSDYSINCRSDVSNAVFAIVAPTPTITVNSPNTATTWYIGNSYNITWTSAYVTDPFVAIEYSYDNGTTWNNIVSSINTSLGTYNWTVPNTPSTQCLVRVKSTANPTTIYDVSNVNFTIATPVWTITVASPNGGESWNSCNTYTINWSAAFVTGSYRIDYSTDNGATWNYIATTTSSSYNWQVPNTIATSGQCLIKVSSVSQPSVYDVSNAVFTINQTQYIVVTSPVGGESWQVANPATRAITWAFTGTTNYFLLEYSTDNGNTWSTIVSNYYAASSPASYTWTIPNNPSTNCLVRISDYSINCRSDVSNTVFSIVAPTPVITVTSPNTSVLWGVGGSYNITWTSSYVTAPFVAIDYSTDGGATWTNIVSAVNTTAGTYAWTVPNTLSNQCRVRVRDNTNASIYDISNVNFSIVPAITVTSPNGGENWGGCTVTSVTWTAYGTSGNFKIEYSTDNGVNWITVVSSYAAGGPNCTYTWTIPHTSSSTCYVRVTDAAAASKTDISNAVFSMFPAIVVTSPAANVAVFAGQTLNINWTSTGVSNYYNIDYSINGGSTWTNIVFNTLIMTNTYAWTVPASLSTNCLIRVTDYQNSCKQDVSDGSFTIAASTANVVVTAPNGNENYMACGSQTINWSAQGTSGNYNLEYSINGGSSWLPIAMGYAAAGPNCSYTWTIPNSLSSNCLIRVTDVANSARTDQSNAIFTISAFAIGATAGTSSVCNGTGTTLTGTGAGSYTWQPGNLSGSSVNVTPTATTTYTVTGVLGTCSAITTVPVTVLALPTVTASTSASNICTGGSVTLTGGGANTYQWSPGNSLNVSNIASPTATPTVTTTFTVVGTNAAGCSNTATVTVNVTSGQSVTATATQTSICPGDNVTLTASGASSYTWMPGNTTGTTLSVSPAVTTTYTVTGTTGTCTGSASLTITVSPPPVVTSSASASTVCAGTGTTLTANGATTYTWMPGNLTGASVTVTPSSTTTYTVTGANGSCTNTSTLTITVNPSPVVTTSGSTTLCTGGTTTLSASGANSYNWMPGNINGASITVTPASSTTYTVTGTGSNGCTATANATVTVSPPPSVSVAGTTTICSGSSTTLTANGATSYTWMPGNLTGSSVTITPAATTTYTVTGTTGTCTDTRTVTVTVNTTPVVTASASQTTACFGNPVTLTGSGASTYTWQPGNLTGSSVSVTPATATTYTVTGSNGTCSSTAQILINVQSVPVVTVSGSTAICSGNSTTLTAAGASSYMWQPGNFPGTSIAVAPSSNTTYTVTGTTGSCAGTQTVTVTVAASPTVTSTASNGTICSGGNSVLTASGASSYTWMPGNINGNNVTVTPTATTTYTVTGVNGSCSSTSTVTVSVSSFVPVTVTGSSTICSGTTSTLTASGASSYSWQPGNLTGSSISVTPSTTTTYTVTGTSGSCAGTQTVTLTVNQTPNVTALGGGGICSGNSASLSASGANSYTWLPINQSGSSVTVAPTSTTTYSVIGTNPGGCTDTATVAVVVNASPTVTVTGGGTICSGNTATLSASGATAYTWQPGNLSGSSISVSPASTTTYTVTGINANGCTATAVTTVTIGSAPAVNVSGGGNSCSGASVALNASGASTYSWQPGSLSGSTVTVAPTSSTTYTVTGTDVNGCVATNTVSITVSPAPSVSLSASSTSICAGGNSTLNASGATSYTWFPGNISGSSIVAAPPVTTTYSVVGTNGIGCTDTATVTIAVNAAPAITVAGGNTVCAGTSSTLTASGALNYTWQPGNINAGSISVAPSSTTTYTVTGVSANGCSGTGFATITVNPVPVVIASGSSNICSGSTTTLNASGAASYSWQPGNLSGSSISVTPASTTLYVVTGTDANGCSSNDSLLLTIDPAPVVSASALQNSFCAGGSTTLTASGAGSYIWQPGNLTGNSVSVTPSVTTTYTVTGTSGNCSSAAQVTITVLPAPSIVITGNTSVCTGSSTTLNATGATNYTWQPGNLSGSSVTVTPATNTTYTITGTDANGCTGSSSVAVTMAPYPTVNATASNPVICAGDAVTLNATGGDIYNWQPGNLGGSAVNVTPSASTTYTVIGTNAGGCNDTTTVSVTVNPLPTVALTLADDTVCTNDFPFALTGGSPAGGVYSGTGVLSGQFDPVTAGVGLHQVVYTYTDPNTGCNNSATQLIYVDACTGIAEAEDAQFSLYPNPAHDVVTLSNANNNEPLKVTLYNSIGQQIGSYMMNGTRLDIDLGPLPVGMYQLSIETKSGIVTRKVVKM